MIDQICMFRYDPIDYKDELHFTDEICSFHIVNMSSEKRYLAPTPLTKFHLNIKLDSNVNVCIFNFAILLRILAHIRKAVEHTATKN